MKSALFNRVMIKESGKEPVAPDVVLFTQEKEFLLAFHLTSYIGIRPHHCQKQAERNPQEEKTELSLLTRPITYTGTSRKKLRSKKKREPHRPVHYTQKSQRRRKGTSTATVGVTQKKDVAFKSQYLAYRVSLARSLSSKVKVKVIQKRMHKLSQPTRLLNRLCHEVQKKARPPRLHLSAATNAKEQNLRPALSCSFVLELILISVKARG